MVELSTLAASDCGDLAWLELEFDFEGDRFQCLSVATLLPPNDLPLRLRIPTGEPEKVVDSNG